MRIILIAISLLLVAAAPARAQDALEHAAETLTLDPVYVAPDAEHAISDGEADDLRAQISDEHAGPLYIAVLPASAGDDPVAALKQIVRTVDQPGVYAAVIGSSFRAGGTQGQLDGRAGELARQAFDANKGDGTAAVLSEFVRLVGKERGGRGSSVGVGPSGGAGNGSDNGGGRGWLVLAALALALGLFALFRGRRRRRRQAVQFARVRKVARDDVIGLGEEIRALDLDVELPDTHPDARQRYNEAVECYQQAVEALERARLPEDLQPVSEQLEAGRYAMEATRARIEGRAAPERRPPCFFDPRHGPSVEDVSWAAPGVTARSVPACAADAVRVREGVEPDTRLVSVNGSEVPYWEAGAAYEPFFERR
ncbi:MAG: hypothetical protein QOE60_3081 [Thermoleophilaceae bacterium]|nr:hypothetical protein [Thermoleophilaceae bacterium]